MMSNKFTESIDIAANPQALFDYTQDYHKRLDWDTFLVEARLLNGAAVAGMGVRAWCVTKRGLGMETEYISFNPPKVAAIKMTRGPRMFKDFAASWNFKDVDSGVTRVTFVYSFILTFPFSLVRFFVRWGLRRNVRQRLIDLQRVFHDPH